ncbi:MAG: 16S rRNA (uracil(1498)-N(3))-methyltransferase [Puniceicoccales bacterium]|jgi:16S rRNA (uracil1498-N3)-methyltransferase|nr:16S rRNA (uracil(1498)-N(3))-methyltransferase [Puniceicoccales bacterium]
MAHFYVYVSDDICEGQPLRLDPATSHHLLRVLRVGENDRITLFDGRGKRADCILRWSANGRWAEVVAGPVEHVPSPKLRPCLLQGLPKGAAMDELLRRATELGAWEIHPVLCRYGDGGLRPTKSPSRELRWRAIATAACRQSRNPFLPTICQPLPLEKISLRSPSLHIVASLEADARPWREVVGHFSEFAGDVYLAVGPEGDFAPEEQHWLRQNDFLPVSLGTRVLTAETAAMTLLAAAQLAWGQDP